MDFGFAILFSEIWQPQRLLVLKPNNKTDLGVHQVSILLQDDNRWIRSKSYQFKITISQLSEAEVGKIKMVKAKKIGKVKLYIKK